MALVAHDLTVQYGDRPVLTGLDLEIPEGKVTVLIGRNGCGKSTVLKALGRLLSPSGGAVLLDGKELAAWESKAIARRLAILPQSPVAPEGLTIEELVRHGRFPHQGFFGGFGKADREAVEQALAATGLIELRDRPLSQLSGGQRQRAWIALALAQETPLLLLDEPTTYLDIAHQIEVLELVVRLNRAEGRTVVMVLHDLNQAARYADHLVAIGEGRVVAQGPPLSLLTADLIRQVFGVEAQVIRDPELGSPICIPRCLAAGACPAAQIL